MVRKGVTVTTFSTAVRRLGAPEDVARALGVEAGREVIRLDRVRGWEERPVVHFRSYLHPRLGLSGQEDYSRPLYEIIQKESGVLAERAHEELAAVPADAGLARTLQAKRGTPLLRRNRTVFDAGGRPIEYAVVHYLSSRFALTLDIRRSGR